MADACACVSQAIVLQHVLVVVKCTSLWHAVVCGGIAWIGFTLPLLHHDAWTRRAREITLLSQGSELIGSLIEAAVVFSIGH
jgi:hypothetical protein